MATEAGREPATMVAGQVESRALAAVAVMRAAAMVVDLAVAMVVDWAAQAARRAGVVR